MNPQHETVIHISSQPDLQTLALPQNIPLAKGPVHIVMSYHSI